MNPMSLLLLSAAASHARDLARVRTDLTVVTENERSEDGMLVLDVLVTATCTWRNEADVVTKECGRAEKVGPTATLTLAPPERTPIGKGLLAPVAGEATLTLEASVETRGRDDEWVWHDGWRLDARVLWTEALYELARDPKPDMERTLRPRVAPDLEVEGLPNEVNRIVNEYSLALHLVFSEVCHGGRTVQDWSNVPSNLELRVAHMSALAERCPQVDPWAVMCVPMATRTFAHEGVGARLRDCADLTTADTADARWAPLVRIGKMNPVSLHPRT